MRRKLSGQSAKEINRKESRTASIARYAIEALEKRLMLSGLYAPTAHLDSAAPAILQVGVPTEITATYTDQDGVSDLKDLELQLFRTDGLDHSLTMMTYKVANKWIPDTWAEWGAAYLDDSSTRAVPQDDWSVTVDWKFTINDQWRLANSGIGIKLNVDDQSGTQFGLGWDNPPDGSSMAFQQPPPLLTASPRIVQQGKTVRLTASRMFGNFAEVDFYRDSNNDGIFEISDEHLGFAPTATGGLNWDGSRVWNWAGSSSNFPIGNNNVFARAETSDGNWGTPITGTVTVKTVTPTRVVGYFPEYSYTSAVLSSIDFNDLSNLAYFRVLLNSNGTLSFQDAEGNTTADPQDLDKFTAAAHAAGCTVSVVIGTDPNVAGSESNFMEVADAPSAAQEFTTEIIQFCRNHALDGIDLDYEPQIDSHDPTDSEVNSFGNLIDVLHSTAPDLLLSAAVSANLEMPQHNYITFPLWVLPSLDWISVMAYDFTPGANQANYDDAITGLDNWRSYGVPATQLVLGVPFYGRPDTCTSWAESDVLRAMSYNNIVNAYIANNPACPTPENLGDTLYATVSDDPNKSAVTATWSFNGPTTILNKTSYALNNGYAGMMIFDVTQDYFDADGKYGAYALLPKIANAIHNSSRGPAVTITSPTEVDSWTPGPAQTITWSVTDDAPSQIDSFLVSYSLDGGATYVKDVGTAVGASRSIFWTPPQECWAPGTVARFRVQARNAANLILSEDVSYFPASFMGEPNWASNYYREDNHYWTDNVDAPWWMYPARVDDGVQGNCTWYAYGRMLELQFGRNATQMTEIAPAGGSQAYLWADHALDAQTYDQSICVDHNPAVGCIAESDSNDHVAVVEHINADRTIVVSESAYAPGSTQGWNFKWRLRTISKSSFKNYIHVTPPAPFQLSWLDSNSTGVNWDSTARTLTVVGAAALVADPGDDLHSLLIESGGHLTITAGANQSPMAASVMVSGSESIPLKLDSINITGTGKLDITNNSIDIYYLDGASPFGAIASLIANGNILSSLAGDGTHAIGYADGVDGIVKSISSGEILIRYTTMGDANLDRTTNFADLVKVAQHYGATNTKWDTGDFTGDGTTGFADLVKVAQNYNTSLSEASLPAATFSADWQGAQTLASAPVVPTATRLAFSSQPAAQTNAGSGPGTITVSVEDAIGHVVTTDNSMVTISISSGSGTLGGTLSMQAVNGVATFSNLMLTTAGQVVLEAMDGNLSNAVSNSFNVKPNAAAKLVFVQQPTNAVPGRAISSAVIVAVEDIYGNIVIADDSTVALAIASGPHGARLSGTVRVKVVNGIASFSGLRLSKAGVYTLHAVDARLKPVTSARFTVIPAAASKRAVIQLRKTSAAR